MMKTHIATPATDARTSRRTDWRASLIVAPLLAATLTASSLFGVMAAPQLVGFIGHVTPASNTILADTPAPSILGGPGIP